MNTEHHMARMSTTAVAERPNQLLDYHVEHCPACGQPIDHCHGHGMIGDPAGYHALTMHNEGHHILCHPAGCDEAL